MDSLNGLTTTESHKLSRNLRLELKEWEQSFAAAHQGRKAGREDIRQHPNIGQNTPTFATCRLLIQPKHTSTSCMTDCEDPLQSNLPPTTPLPRKSAPLPLLTRFPHSTHHISVRSMLTPSALQRLNLVHRLLRTCLP